MRDANRDLIDWYFSATEHDAARIARLEQLLRDDPAASEYFGRLALLESNLHRWGQLQSEAAAQWRKLGSARPATDSFRPARDRRAAARGRRKISRTRAWLKYFAAPLAVAASLLLAAHFVNVWNFERAQKALCAEVIELGGPVELKGAQGTAPARKGDLVRPGESLKTGAGGHVKLRYEDKTTLELKDASNLSLRKNQDLKDPSKRLHLECGELSADVVPQKPEAPMVLGTPHAEARVLGTIFRLRAANAQTRLEVDSGRVRLKELRGRQEVEVATGEFAVAAEGLALVVRPLKNVPPVAQALKLTTAEGEAAQVTLKATDVNADALTYVIAEQPKHGSLSGSLPTVTYTPAADYSGPDRFSYKANDGKADSAVARVSMTVTPVNDVPVANSQSASTDEDATKEITLTASDADGDALTYSIVTHPAHGRLSGTKPNLTYTPNADYSGADGFTFKVSDGRAESQVATVSITVKAVNDAPKVTVTGDRKVVLPAKARLEGEVTDDGPAGALRLTWSKVAGPGDVTFDDASKAETTASFSKEGTYLLRLTASDGEHTASGDFTITPEPAPPPNLLADPGFEEGGQKWLAAGAKGASIVGKPAHSGARSLQLKGAPGTEAEAAQEIPVIPGRRYRVVAWAKASGTRGRFSFKVTLIWRDAAGNNMKFGNKQVCAVGSTQDWRRFSIQCAAPAKARTVRFLVRGTALSRDASATAWFDDLSFREVK